MKIFLVPVADHAVGGIERLIGENARQSEQCCPENRCDNAIGEILCQRFDGASRNTGLVEPGRFASDDLRDGLPPARETVYCEGVGDGADMQIQAALCDQDRNQQPFNDPAKRERTQRGVDDHADCAAQPDNCDHRKTAQRDLGDGAVTGPVPDAVQRRNGAAHQDDRMWDAAIQPVGIPGNRIAQKGEGERQERQWGDHQGPLDVRLFIQ